MERNIFSELTTYFPHIFDEIINHCDDGILMSLLKIRNYGILNLIVKHKLIETLIDTLNICHETIKNDWKSIFDIDEIYQTRKICDFVVKHHDFSLTSIEKQPSLICLAAVKQDVGALEHVNEQTEEICLVAVKLDGYALQYVKKQTKRNMFSCCETKWVGITICQRTNRRNMFGCYSSKWMGITICKKTNR